MEMDRGAAERDGVLWWLPGEEWNARILRSRDREADWWCSPWKLEAGAHLRHCVSCISWPRQRRGTSHTSCVKVSSRPGGSDGVLSDVPFHVVLGIQGFRGAHGVVPSSQGDATPPVHWSMF